MKNRKQGSNPGKKNFGMGEEFGNPAILNCWVPEFYWDPLSKHGQDQTKTEERNIERRADITGHSEFFAKKTLESRNATHVNGSATREHSLMAAKRNKEHCALSTTRGSVQICSYMAKCLNKAAWKLY